MAITASTVNVGTTATALSSADDTGSGGRPGMSLAIQPASQIFVGPAGVTTSTGFPVAAGASFTADLGAGEALYGVAASGTVAVSVLEIGV